MWHNEQSRQTVKGEEDGEGGKKREKVRRQTRRKVWFGKETTAAEFVPDNCS